MMSRNEADYCGLCGDCHADCRCEGGPVEDFSEFLRRTGADPTEAGCSGYLVVEPGSQISDDLTRLIEERGWFCQHTR